MLDLEDLLEFAESHMLAPELKDGIHGVKHWRRTAMIAEMIWDRSPWANRRKFALRVIQMAAVFHDIGRVSDKADATHGYGGAGWLLKITSKSWDIRNSIEADAWGEVLDIIIHHCEPGPGTFPEMQIVKDADKCDRFRLSEEGPDPSRLALDVTRDMLPEIKEFVLVNL